jgi:selenocysteine-specific elongation factor
MPRDLILGTAGHIDHGKTSLVKALTGIDCDRLPEEKARGITIDIGFAILELGDFRLGIVDVPGHDRFIKNMLAGATGIDLAILVVAADDSVMPQTHEHLEILQLLGLRHGLIALTKCDAVDATTREVAELEIRELVQGTFLENSPIVAVSSLTGDGIDELRTALAEVCQRVEARAQSDWFRMAIDRSFVVQGHGTVVTGSVNTGGIRVGDEVEWLPRQERVRVRSLQSHDLTVEQAHRGMRAAVNLAGVPHEEIIRGQEIATPGFLLPSRVVTVRLHCLAGRARPIKHRLPARFHAGTGEVMGTVSLLDCDKIDPGQWGLAQLFLEEPVTTVWGQPFILRESSAAHTLGGGQVLQPFAHKIRRRHLELQELLEKLWTGDEATRVSVVAWFAGFAGVAEMDLVRGAGTTRAKAATLVEELKTAGILLEFAAKRRLLLHADMAHELEDRLLKGLSRLHAQFPLMSGHHRPMVQSQLDYVGDESLVNAVVERLLERKKLVGDGRRIALADFKPKLSGNLRKLKETIVAAYRQARFQPPEPAGFAGQAGGNAGNLKDLFELCIAEGHLVAVSDSIYLHTDADSEMRGILAAHLQNGAALSVAEIRDLLGTTRKYAVPFCEYLDRIGVTRREGDQRVLAGK